MKAWRILWTLGLVGTPATAQEPFPCGELKGEYRIIAALGPAAPPTSRSAVKVKKKAIVANQAQPVLWHWSKPEGVIGAAVPYQKPQLFFRRYLIDGDERNCAEGRRDDVFGVGDSSRHYLLRCLVDADGDGRFEAYRRYGELVLMSQLTAKPGPSLEVAQVDEPLVQPFRLLPATDARTANTFYDPVLRSIIRVKEVRKDSVLLQSRAYIENFRSELEEGFGNKGDGTTIELSLQDGVDARIHGTRIVIAGSPGKWTIAAPDGFGETARLICEGRVLETSEAFTVLYAGAMSIHPKVETSRPD